MSDREIINKYYHEAVEGLTQELLSDNELWYNHVLNLSKKHQVVYTIGVLNQQVVNGGFHQYFFNSYGQFAYLTVENLELIKAFRTASLLKSALSRVNEQGVSENEFVKKYTTIIKKIFEFEDSLSLFLDSLDSEYYLNSDLVEEGGDGEVLGELIANYLRNG